MNYTNQEKEYIYSYIKYSQRSNNNLSMDDWKELKDIRESLGIEYSKSTELIENSDFYGLIEPYNSLRKNKIIYDYKTIKGADLDEKSKKLEEFDNFIAQIYQETSALSEKVSLVADEYYNISNTLLSESVKRYKRGNKTESYLVGGIAAIIAGFGYFEEQEQLKKIEIEKQRKIQELKRKRAEYAREKIEITKTAYNICIQNEDRYVFEYEQWFSKKVNSGNEGLALYSVNKFITAFNLVCKTYYQKNILNFFLAEFEAWLNGYDASDVVPYSMVEVIDLHVSEWPKLLDVSDWDSFLLDNITNDKQYYNVPIFSLFINPFLFRNYVGVELPNIDSTNKCIIKKFVNGQKICQPIEAFLEKNIYYKKIDDLFYKTVSKPDGVSGADYGIIILLAVVLAVISFFIWKYSSGFIFVILSSIFCFIIGKGYPLFVNSLPFVREYENFIATRKKIVDEEHFYSKKNNGLILK